MAQRCIKGMGECIGRGYCKQEYKLIDVFGDPIYPSESYYEIDGEIISFDNLYDWAKQFKRECHGE